MGNRYTNKQYSSKGKEVVNNVEVVGSLLCDLTNLSFMNGLLKLKIPTLASNNWLSIGVDRKSK